MDITPNMLARWILLMYFCVNFKLTATEEDCSPVYVRWARVRLNLTARVAGPYSLDNCTRSCTSGHNPARPSYPIECYGFNHKQGANSLSHDCQLFQREQLQNVDGHVEADDRYSFYWKYCAKTTKMCKSQYQFDFYIDRFMDSSEVQRTINTDKVEDCLSRCLDETSFTCRSVSFNRTANVCSLSSQSQVTKPGYLRVNNNPNYRIDYYENNCFNESFTFHHDCRDNGVVVSVESKFPYTGALYGLYDFFTCRIEPKDELRFSLFFPYSTYSKNCTDSFSQKENNNVLDVVLSTDGMDPLYFLTDQDMLYQAKCPITSNSIAAAPTAVGATVVFVVPPGSSPSTSFETSESQTLSTTASTSLPITSERFSTFSTKKEVSSTDSTETSTVYETSTKEQSKSVELAKKPVYTLPVIDFTPEVEKSITDDSLILGRGSKITVIVNYPKNNWNDSDDDDDSTTKTLNIATEGTSLASESTTVSRDVKTWKGSWEKIDHSESSTIRSSTVTHERSSTFTPYEKPPKLVLRGDNVDFDASSTARFSSLTSTASSTLIGKTESRSPTTIVSTVRSSSPSTTSVSSSSSSTSTTVASTATSESTSARTVATTQSTETSGSSSSTSTTSPNQRTTSSESPESLNRFTKEWYNSRFDPFGNIGKPINSESATSPSFASTSSETTSTLSASTLSSTTPATTTIPSTTTATTTTAKASTNFEKGVDKLSTSSPTNGFFDTSRSTSSSTTQNVSLKSSSNSNNSTSNILHTTSPPQKILFDIYHNNQPVNAVVVGSRIILTFTPGLGVPAPYVSIIGCQVEPVNSPYAFEKDPLQIIKNGCQADGVGLVCPPARTDYGIKIEMEAFRYTTTSEVLYSCIVRICAFNPCPQPFCNPVDGCYAPNNAASPVLLNSPGLLNGNSGFNSPGLINNPGFNGFINNQGVNSPGFANSPGSFGSAGRRKRQQQRPSPFLPLVPAFQVPGAFQQNLLGSAGDILVSKRLVVVNSDIELQYYLRTGNVPTNNNFNGLLGR